MLRLLIALVGLPCAALAQRPVIEISGANFRPMPLAVAIPATQDDGTKASLAEFDAALTFDLSACGLFQVLDRKSFLSNEKEGVTASAITFDNWLNVGAESLVKTQLSTDGATLKADLRLFSVAAGREELKVSQAGPASNPRAVAHALANAVYKHFTRETGPFLTRLAYVKKSSTGKDVYLADWDGANAARVTSGGINVLPAVLPDGKGAAFTTYARGRPELFVQRPGEKGAVLVSAGKMVSGVEFAPDGKHMAYAVSEGENSEIWVANADGSGSKRITDSKYFLNSSPTWSPDGKRIAFVSNRGGNPQIYVMGADGSNAKRLTFQGNYNTTPVWSPRGDIIAFTARDERNAFDLFSIEVDTSKVKRLTQDTGNNEEPTFSPNGRLIIFSSTRAGGQKLHVMTFDGNNQLALPGEPSAATTADWGN